MSSWYSHDFACPGCGDTMAATLTRGVDARRAPQVREQILRGELHQVRCQSCDAAVDAQREVAYTDFGRHHWVHVARPVDLERWQAVERDALARFDHVRERASLVGADQRIRLRSIEGSGDLVLSSVVRRARREEVARWTMPATVVAATIAAAAEWRARVPELFGRGFCSLDRYLR